MTSTQLTDPNTGLGTDLSSFSRAEAVVPATEEEVFDGCRGLYIGTGGDLVVRLAQSTADITLVDAPAGYHLLAVTHVRPASTAADIVALG